MPGLVAKFHALGQVDLSRLEEKTRALADAADRAEKTLSILGTVPQADLDGMVAGRVVSQLNVIGKTTSKGST